MKTKIFFLAFVCMAFWLAGCSKTGSPHFVGKVTAILAKDGLSVLVTWKESGLGNNQNIDYEASAAGVATHVCVNAGGQCPNASNKTTMAGPVIANVTLASGQNGQIIGTMVLLPPGPGKFACPGGQVETLADFALTDLQIRDVTNDVSKAAEPDEISATTFVCP